MTAAILICDARAEHCHCGLQPGHDGPHRCALDTCAGAWQGDWRADDFRIVTFPEGITREDGLTMLFGSLLGDRWAW